jgi:hypothetical protein
MTYGLREGLSFCQAGDRTIFLDLKHNRYFALGADDDAAFEALVRSGNQDDSLAFERFARSGLVQASTHARPIAPCAKARAAEISILDVAEAANSTWARFAISHQLITTAFLMRARPLDHIVAGIVRAKRRLRPHVGDRTAERQAAAHALEWTRRYLTSHERCLLRSIALVRHLLGRRIATELVFGVTTRPFRAHCWVEHDDVLLTDRADTVRNYTPILVV